MRHQPKKLALLISLIGAGVSPDAFAADEAWLPGLPAVAEEIPIVEPAQTALDRTRWLREWGDVVDSGEVVLLEQPKAPVATVAANADWAPGEVPPEQATSGPPVVLAMVATPETARPLPLPNTKAKPTRAKAYDAAGRPTKQAQLRDIARDPKPVVSGRVHMLIAARIAQYACERKAPLAIAAAVVPAPPAPVVNAGPSVHADRLMDLLADVVLDPPRPFAEAAPPVAVEPIASARLVVPPPRPEPEVAVAPQSDKVLRSLEALLFEPRDEVGAIRTDPQARTVATESDKVLENLFDLTAPPAVVEDGPAKRARKLAALKVKAEAAAAAAATAKPFGGDKVAVSEASLDQVRGGFIVDDVKISFGIERAVYINGTLVTTTTLNVSDLGKVSAARSANALDSRTLALVKSGAGNVVANGAMSAGAIGTVIQNTVDGQKIQNMTIINATVNSMGVLRGLNLQSSMRGAVIDSLRH